MTIKEIKQKILDGEALSDEEKKFLADYEEPDVEAASNAKAKKERLKHEQQMADMKAQLAEQAEALEAAQAGGSETEKLQRDFEKLNAKYADLAKQFESEQAAHSQTKREHALSSIDVKWLDGISPKLKKTLLAEHFQDIETDDLTDASVTQPLVEKFVETYPQLIGSGVAGGAGTGKPGDNANKQTTGDIKLQFNKTSDYQKDVRPQLDAAWAASREQGK